MTVETEVANLTTAVDNLTSAVNVSKATLDASVADAEAAQSAAAASASTASGHASSAAASAAAAAATASGLAGFDLDAIAATKAVTAVDVFVYDTSKDSDGGAWRKRTQGTSWYNETLNTATRGSRREFPAVAVIVAEAAKVTIYDGDDPSLPMWMVFNNTGYGAATGSCNAVVAFNGEVVTSNGSGSLREIFFITDTWQYRAGSVYKSNGSQFLLDRNTSATGWVNQGYGGIVNSTTNDVAMTVLPNAPIDPATGLPVPTIAVATDGGVSVIKDDGTVVDITKTSGGNAWNRVAFTEQDQLKMHSNTISVTWLLDIPSTDIGASVASGPAEVSAFTATNLTVSGSKFPRYLGFSNTGSSLPNNWGSSSGLTFHSRNASDENLGMVAYTASTYNTGWMNGDIKGAFLSDTDDTDLVGSGELVTNGDFGTGDLTGWTDSSIGTGTATVNGSNQLELYRLDVSNRGIITQNITFTSGVLYVVTFTKIDSSANIQCKVGNSNPDTASNLGQVQAAGQYSFTFSSTQYLHFLNVSNGTTAVIDNISIKFADKDRSVNNKGLIVNGTVTRTPVATGADLVAYSGFSASNYLEQPYNSDLDFGTGDFCVMGWLKDAETTATDYLFDRLDGGGYFRAVFLAQTVRFTISGTSITTTENARDGTWKHLCFVRSNGVAYIYVDGRVSVSGASAGDVDGGAPTFTLGTSSAYSGAPNTASMALWRISATAPTAEQIKKIYNDEKVLFQEGAQATLYGSSAAVTALAHDSDTGILSVGTSAGRSDFQGLRRVNNTTNAVGVAISAAGGMIVEE